jgi:hypothetical protein
MLRTMHAVTLGMLIQKLWSACAKGDPRTQLVRRAQTPQAGRFDLLGAFETPLYPAHWVTQFIEATDEPDQCGNGKPPRKERPEKDNQDFEYSDIERHGTSRSREFGPSPDIWLVARVGDPNGVWYST